MISFDTLSSGAVIADVVLYDPTSPDDNSTTVIEPMMIPKRSSDHYRARRPVGLNRSISPRLNTLNAGSSSLIPTHQITNYISASDGPVILSYLHHPPSTALLAKVNSDSDEVDVSLHPNYVGPFALRNVWGQIRVPQPNCESTYPYQNSTYANSTNKCLDPQGWDRTRQVVLGPIDVTDPFYASGGIGPATLSSGYGLVTGAAYWSDTIITASSVQNGTEGRGSGLFVTAAWGDVMVSVDGT